PCTGPSDGMIDPVTAYGRSRGTYITAGATVPTGLWPAGYDGVYLFADGGSGVMWARHADGAVDYDQPFATKLSGISDMVFGFDGDGRAVLYTVSVGGTLGMIAPVGTSEPLPSTQMAYQPLPPYRVFDTANGTGGTSVGDMVAGTTRTVET